jgi:hypothetical protein
MVRRRLSRWRTTLRRYPAEESRPHHLSTGRFSSKTPHPRELTIKAMNYLKTSGRVSIVGGVVELVG